MKKKGEYLRNWDYRAVKFRVELDTVEENDSTFRQMIVHKFRDRQRSYKFSLAAILGKVQLIICAYN